MNVVLWILQVLLALVFGYSGMGKATKPREELKERIEFVEDFTDGQIKMIGILEILGAVGLILPAVTGILPWLTPLAAVGLVLTMIGAALTHLRRGNETQMIVGNFILGAMAAFVAYGRFVEVPL